VGEALEQTRTQYLGRVDACYFDQYFFAQMIRLGLPRSFEASNRSSSTLLDHAWRVLRTYGTIGIGIFNVRSKSSVLVCVKTHKEKAIHDRSHCIVEDAWGKHMLGLDGEVDDYTESLED
jgi:hypothetical protein